MLGGGAASPALHLFFCFGFFLVSNFPALWLLRGSMEFFFFFVSTFEFIFLYTSSVFAWKVVYARKMRICFHLFDGNGEIFRKIFFIDLHATGYLAEPCRRTDKSGNKNLLFPPRPPAEENLLCKGTGNICGSHGTPPTHLKSQKTCPLHYRQVFSHLFIYFHFAHLLLACVRLVSSIAIELQKPS